jgi:hypothetical protein
MAVRGDRLRPRLPVGYSERADGYGANAVAVWFHTRFAELGIEGASSHFGRRTFITAAAKKITEAGGMLDNGPIHIIKASLAALALRDWLTIQWLPKYAPELNDIERS